MSLVALTNFITVTNPNGSVPDIPDKFQNGRHGHPTEGNKVNGHDYLSFIYQGATRNRTGDNMTSSVILANNELSMNYAQQIVKNKYHIRVETCLMTEDFEKKLDPVDNEPIVVTDEQWLASSMSYDPETIEIILTSAIDAVGAQSSNRVLTRKMVGYLPVTGTLQNR
tara:strand:- start:775 stop:1278 length:504 start_codon:yes stop_codon:yes gene_type:complete